MLSGNQMSNFHTRTGPVMGNEESVTLPAIGKIFYTRSARL